MVERIEQLRPELPAEPLRDLEPLAQRRIHVEELRPEERIPRDIPERPRSRPAPWTTGAAVRIEQRRCGRRRLTTLTARSGRGRDVPLLRRRIIEARVA